MSHGPRYKAILELLPHKISIGGREVTLTVAQATLFKQLYDNKEKICSRSFLEKIVDNSLKLAGVVRPRSHPANPKPRSSIEPRVSRLRAILDNANPDEFPNLSEIIETITDMEPLPKLEPRTPRYEGGYMLRVPEKYTLTLENKIYVLERRAAPG
jgi:hypothetical protein